MKQLMKNALAVHGFKLYATLFCFRSFTVILQLALIVCIYKFPLDYKYRYYF